jgi:hypothetical protein
MLITELKSKETILSLVSGKAFLLNCQDAKKVSFPEAEVKAQDQTDGGPQGDRHPHHGLHLQPRSRSSVWSKHNGRDRGRDE